MREYSACLNVCFYATDEEEALEIAESFEIALRNNTASRYKVTAVEADDLEEL
jgi:hypothetical protein